jgi:hypothetical protein
MSPCLLLYGLAALVGAVLGGPAGRIAAALLVTAVLARHLLARDRQVAGPAARLRGRPRLLARTE